MFIHNYSDTEIGDRIQDTLTHDRQSPSCIKVVGFAKFPAQNNNSGKGPFRMLDSTANSFLLC